MSHELVGTVITTTELSDQQNSPVKSKAVLIDRPNNPNVFAFYNVQIGISRLNTTTQMAISPNLTRF